MEKHLHMAGGQVCFPDAWSGLSMYGMCKASGVSIR